MNKIALVKNYNSNIISKSAPSKIYMIVIFLPFEIPFKLVYKISHIVF